MKRPPGPPPKPNELKRKLGNPGQRPLPKPESVTALDRLDPDIELPDHLVLGTGGRWLFDHIVETVAWLARSDLVIVVKACQLEDDIARLRYRFHKYGHHRDATVMAKLLKEQTSMLSSLGMSPSDRTRLSVGEVKVMKDSLKIAAALKSSSQRPKEIIVQAIAPPNYYEANEGSPDAT